MIKQYSPDVIFNTAAALLISEKVKKIRGRVYIGFDTLVERTKKKS